MKLPELQEVKFNKRAKKETPVLRVYTTRAGNLMYFCKIRGAFSYLNYPYFFWSLCSFYPQKGRSYPALVAFQARICGLGE